MSHLYSQWKDESTNSFVGNMDLGGVIFTRYAYRGYTIPFMSDVALRNNIATYLATNNKENK